MPAAGFGGEEGVEGDDAIDSALRYAEALGDVVLEFRGEVAVEFLGLVQHRSGRRPLPLPAHESIQFWTVGFQIEAHVRSLDFPRARQPIATDRSRSVGDWGGGRLATGAARLAKDESRANIARTGALVNRQWLNACSRAASPGGPEGAGTSLMGPLVVPTSYCRWYRRPIAKEAIVCDNVGGSKEAQAR